VPTWLPGLILSGLASAGGLGLYRFLRLQRAETAVQIGTAAEINESFKGLLAAYQADYDRVRAEREQARAERDEERVHRRELIDELRACRTETRELRERLDRDATG
jgi:predicted  nucleic acid-binding Zn-ribbon protein